MTDETVTIDNLPDVNDINVLLEAISGIGARLTVLTGTQSESTEATLKILI